MSMSLQCLEDICTKKYLKFKFNWVFYIWKDQIGNPC